VSLQFNARGVRSRHDSLGRGAPDVAIERLFLNGVADVLNGFADLAFDAADGVLRLSSDFVGDTFVVQSRIVRQVADRLLNFAFERFGLAFYFIAIHTCSFSLMTADVCNACDSTLTAQCSWHTFGYDSFPTNWHVLQVPPERLANVTTLRGSAGFSRMNGDRSAAATR
jgi:hypothetical protein